MWIEVTKVHRHTKKWLRMSECLRLGCNSAAATARSSSPKARYVCSALRMVRWTWCSILKPNPREARIATTATTMLAFTLGTHGGVVSIFSARGEAALRFSRHHE